MKSGVRDSGFGEEAAVGRYPPAPAAPPPFPASPAKGAKASSAAGLRTLPLGREAAKGELEGDSSAWRPTASLASLRLRAELLAAIRQFFADRGVMEVETPLLSAATATDVHLSSIAAGSGFLHTSPEFPMKRLLAAGAGDIYQLCHVFRDGEAGRLHNPEFTLLEWYRTGFDHHALMDEVADLVRAVLPGAGGEGERMTYRQAFERHAGFDPFTAGVEGCRSCLSRAGVATPAEPDLDYDGWLDLVAGAVVYPRLGRDSLCFIYDYPVSQAALARVRPDDPPVAERFEVFMAGIELANGYHELTDAVEQRRRFETDLARRHELGLPEPPMDERLLAALEAGLPGCAGVALGVDRLALLAVGAEDIGEVIAFAADRA